MLSATPKVTCPSTASPQSAWYAAHARESEGENMLREHKDDAGVVSLTHTHARTLIPTRFFPPQLPILGKHRGQIISCDWNDDNKFTIGQIACHATLHALSLRIAFQLLLRCTRLFLPCLLPNLTLLSLAPPCLIPNPQLLPTRPSPSTAATATPLRSPCLSTSRASSGALTRSPDHRTSTSP